MVRIILHNTTTDPRTEGFSNKQVRRATSVDRIRQIMCASEADMRLVSKGQVMPDANVTPEDLLITNKIFGPNLAGLKGRSTRPPSKPVNPSMEPISPSILANNSRVQVAIDIMFINKCRFLVSYNKVLKYGTLHRLLDAKQLSLERCLKEIDKIYQRRGFRITHLLADNQFQCLQDCAVSLHTLLTIVPSDGHVHEIERFIRLIKERCRGLYNTTPFKGVPIPNVMTDGLARSAIFWVIAIPRPDSACGSDPPILVMQGFRATLALHGKFKWGDYVQTIEKTSNSMRERTVGAIFLHPANSPSGGYYFMSLETGKRLHRMKATTLPMPADVVTRVKALARVRPSNSFELEFLDRDRNPIVDLPSDANLIEPDEDDPGANLDDHSIASNNSAPLLDGPGVVSDDETTDADNMMFDPTTYDVDSAAGVDDGSDPDYGSASKPPSENAGVDEDSGDPPENAGVDDDETFEDPTGNPGVEAESPGVATSDETGVPRMLREIQEYNKSGPKDAVTRSHSDYSTYNLRSRQPTSRLSSRNVPHEQADVVNAINNFISGQTEPITQLLATVLTQYNMKQGIRLFGDRALEAIRRELKQFHTRKVWRPRRLKELTLEMIR